MNRKRQHTNFGDGGCNMEKKNSMLKNIPEPWAIEIDEIDGYQFEELIAKIMKKKGYENIRVTPKSKDVGKDIVMESQEGEIILVECKHQSFVGRPVIQKLQGAMSHEEKKHREKEVR